MPMYNVERIAGKNQEVVYDAAGQAQMADQRSILT